MRTKLVLPALTEALFDAMLGMGRPWQAAGTVDAVLRPGLLEKAVACGLRSLFAGFETLGAEGLRALGKRQNLGRDYWARSCAGPPTSPTSSAVCATPPTPSAGRSASPALRRGERHPPAEGPRQTCYRPAPTMRGEST